MSPKPSPQPGQSKTLTASQQADLDRAKRAARWVGLVFPLTLLTAALVMVLVWLPRMPDPAATHWSGSGGPDGFGSPWTYVWLLLLVGHGIVLMIWGFIEFSGRIPAASPKRPMALWSANQRFLAAFSAGFAVLMTVTLLASVIAQLDIADAADAGGVGVPVALGFGAWAVVSVIGWFVQPKVEIRGGEGEPALPLPLKDSERAVWFGEVRPSKSFLLLMAVVIVAVVTSVVFVFTVSSDTLSRVVIVASLVLVVVLTLLSTWFKVRIDAGGIEVRSIVGWPVFRVRTNDIKHVEATQINPFPEFGGWGMRWAPRRFGVVMRAGEGIVITRTNGSIFAVTLDDSETAAKALAAAVRASRKAKR